MNAQKDQLDDSPFWRPGLPNPGPAYLGANNLAKDKYKAPDHYLKEPDAIVIGSGIGGLSISSILAQKKGYKVLLLEGNSVPGGCTHCHELGGFEWNSGIDSIGDMDPRMGRGIFRPTIDYITKGSLQWAKMPNAHEIAAFGDDAYPFFSTPEENIEWIERLFPGEGDVRGYYKLEDRIEWWAWSWTVTKLLPEWVPVWLRDFIYTLSGGSWRRCMLKTTQEILCGELGFSKRLAAIFSYMYGNHGRTPELAPFAFHAMNLFHYRYGAYYPVGGPGQIAECIIPVIEEAGGQLAVNSRVKKILIENNTAVGVLLDNGEEIRSKLVISDASAYTTFMELIDREVADNHGYPPLFDELGSSPAHLYLFLGYDEEIDLPAHIIWQMPTYEGVDPYDLDAADRSYKETSRFEGMGGYLLSPSARDPVYTQRYPGKSTVIALAEAPPEFIRRFKEEPEYHEMFKREVEKNLTKLVHRHMPGLRDKTPSYRRCGVPMGCNPYAWNGSSLGLDPSGDRFVKHTHWTRPATKIKNLYLTGQDCFSASFAGSMLGGRVCYSAIFNDWMFMAKAKP